MVCDMMGHVDNTEATPLVAGESVTTERGASGSIWDNLQKDYERLGSFKAVAKFYGVAPETVSRKAKELGVSSARRWRMNNLDPEELRRLYEAGATVPELAKQFKSSQSSIYLRLWQAGTEMRRTGHDGWTWGPEQYEKRRLANERGAYEGAQRERFRRNGHRAPKVNSPSEVRLQQALIRASIGFETQLKLLGKYFPDVLINQKPVIIEADSWAHAALPENAAFDKRRDAALKAAGYTVVRFANRLLETDAAADRCVRQVIEQLGLLPEVNPVFVIRDRMGDD